MSTIRLASLWMAVALTFLVVAGSASAQDQPPPQQQPQQPVMQLQPQPQQPAQPPPGYGQPTYGQQQPGYGYGYGQPPQQQQVDPREGWRSGDPVPAGYRIETSPRWGLVGAGIGMLGGGWLISTMIGYVAVDAGDEDAYQLMIPVIGPLLMIKDTSGAAEGLVDSFLIFDAAVQIAGTVMLTLGQLLQREHLVPDHSAGVTAFLAPTEQGLVGGLGGRF